jgi:hypothetical protein
VCLIGHHHQQKKWQKNIQSGETKNWENTRIERIGRIEWVIEWWVPICFVSWHARHYYVFEANYILSTYRQPSQHHHHLFISNIHQTPAFCVLIYHSSFLICLCSQSLLDSALSLHWYATQFAR